MFQVSSDPKELFDVLYHNMLYLSDTGNEPEKSKCKYKIKQHVCRKNVPLQDVECDLLVRLIHDENKNRVFVEFQRINGDQDLFIESYTCIKN